MLPNETVNFSNVEKLINGNLHYMTAGVHNRARVGFRDHEMLADNGCLMGSAVGPAFHDEAPRQPNRHFGCDSSDVAVEQQI